MRRRRYSDLLRVLGWELGLLMVAGILVEALYVEPSRIEVRRSLEYVPALRASTPDLLLVHLSDLHLERLGKRERRAIEIVNAAQADIIVVSGDLIGARGSATTLQGFLAALRSRYGNFAVWGRSDYQNGAAECWEPEAVRRGGFTLLRNGSRSVGTPAGRIEITGVDDPASGRDNLRQAMARVPRSAFCLLVSHDPEVVETLGNWDIDMAFTGQERTGVLRPPPVGALFGSLGMGDDLEGWFDVAGGVRLHVSRGLGWRGLPIPGLCRPRIDLITLRGGSPPTRRAHRVIERS